MNQFDVQELLIKTKRDKWYNAIKPLVTQQLSYWIYLDDLLLPFSLDDLKKKKFNIEPGFYTHKKYKGLVYINNYLSLDSRYKSEYKEYYVIECGSKVDTFFGVNDKGYTYGFESGLHPLYSIADTHYSNFEKTNYKPVEGELLYYIQKLYNKEITPKTYDYEDSIFCYSSGGFYKKTRRKFLIGDTSHRKSLEKFFIDYD